MRAGIDRREQKKAGAELERATVAKIRKTQARPARRGGAAHRGGQSRWARMSPALRLARPAARAPCALQG